MKNWFMNIFSGIIDRVMGRKGTDESPRLEYVKSRIDLFRPRFALVALSLMMGVMNVWGDWSGTPTNSGGVWYVVDDADERSIFQEESTQYNLSGPGANLTFDAYRTSFLGMGAIQNLKVSDGYSVIFDVFIQKDKYESYPTEGTLTVNANTQTLTFYGATAATLSRKIKNVKVTMADHVLLADGTVNGTGTISRTLSATAYGNTSSACHIDLRSFLIAGTKIRYKITSDENSEFSFASDSRVSTKDFSVMPNSFAMIEGLANCASIATSIGNPDYQEVDVYFTPAANTNEERSATITIYDVSDSGVETERATISLTAKVIPIFHFKATAVATDGGAAVKASFVENSFSGASVTTSMLGDNEDATSQTTTAYFYAPATNEAGDYFFEGWYAEEDCSGTRLSTGDKISRTITSTSLNSAAPTETKYYAQYLDSIYAEFYGETSVAMNVDETYSDGISYFRTSAEVASDSNADGFWYEIRNNTPEGVTSGSAHPDSIIAYDPETKSVKAYNAGTATLVLHQHIYPYATVSKEYTFTVSKYPTTLEGTVTATMKVDETQTITLSATGTTATYPLAGNTNDFFYTIDPDFGDNDETTGCAEGHESDVIGYDPIKKEITAYNAGSATLRIAQKETYKYKGDTLDLAITEVSKYTPANTWNASGAGYYYGSVIPNIFSGDEAGGVEFESSDELVATMDDETNTLTINPKVDGHSATTITITQSENYKFTGRVTNIEITPQVMPPGVPFVYKEAQYNNSLVTIEKTPYCSITDVDKSDDHILFNDGSHTGTHYVIIHFEGMPDKMTFGYKAKENAGTRVMYIQQSATNSFSDSGPILWSKSDLSKDSWTTETIQLDPTTRYLKIRFVNNTNKTCGRFRLNSITELQGYKYLKNDDKYVSRGRSWCTQAIMDQFGTPVRITRETSDNTNYTTKLMFVDSEQYLYESGDDIYTDNSWASEENRNKTIWTQTVDGEGKVTLRSATNTDKYITVTSGNLVLTTTPGDATKWELEDYTAHQALMEARVNSLAVTAATNTDLASEVSTLSDLSSAVSAQYLDPDTVYSDTEYGEQKYNLGRSAGGYETVYPKSLTGLEPGLYRLSVQAFCHPAKSFETGLSNHTNGYESVLAYMYAGNDTCQIKSLFDEGEEYPTDATEAEAVFDADANNFKNEMFVYVSGTSLNCGIHNPSAAGGTWVAYKNFTVERVSRGEFTFDSSNGKSWSTQANWGTKTRLPGEYDKVTISSDVEISGEEAVYSLSVGDSKKVTILPTGGLTVGVGGITGAGKDNIKLKAGTGTKTEEGENGYPKGQTGYLRVSPDWDGTMPNATVELFSKAYADNSNQTATWQYVGSPLEDKIYGWDICTYGNQFIYGWSEKDGDWFDCFDEKLSPFHGYSLTQNVSPNGGLFTFTGKLVEPEEQTVNLGFAGDAESGNKGYNVVANSFTAPIDISKMNTTTDFVNATATIYMFNTGSPTDVANNPTFADKTYSTAGQYIEVTPGTAKVMYQNDDTYPVLIPAMQGFCVKATATGAKLKLNYRNVVWDADYDTHPNKPLRVAAQKTEEQEASEPNVTDFIKVTLADGEAADILYLLASESYDKSYENGYDAPKMMSDDPALPNVFAVEDDGQFAIDATSDIEGTFIGVRTGAASNYTIYFSHVNAETEWMLLDIQENKKTRIANEASYSFSAKANSLLTNRFVIVEWDGNAGTATGTEETTIQNKIQKFIYNDQLFILKDGVLYDARGMVVRR